MGTRTKPSWLDGAIEVANPKTSSTPSWLEGAVDVTNKMPAKAQADAPVPEEKGVLGYAKDSLKALPGAAWNLAKDAGQFAHRFASGDIPTGELAERAGTAVRGAADMALAPGYYAGTKISDALTGQHSDASHPFSKIADTVEPDMAEARATQDQKYPGARAAGQLAVGAAFAPATIGRIAATGAGLSAGTQIADKGDVNVRQAFGDGLAGAVIPAGLKVAKVGATAARVGLGNTLDSAAEGIASKFGNADDAAFAKQYTQDPSIKETVRTGATRKDELGRQISDENIRSGQAKNDVKNQQIATTDELKSLKQQRPQLANAAEERATQIMKDAEARKNAKYDAAFSDANIDAPVPVKDAHFHDAEADILKLAKDDQIITHFPSVSKELQNSLNAPTTKAISDLKTPGTLDPANSTITVGDDLNHIKDLRTKLSEQYSDLADLRTPEARKARRAISKTVGSLTDHLDDAASALTDEGYNNFKEANQNARDLFTAQKIQSTNTVRKDVDVNQKTTAFQDAGKLNAVSKAPSQSRQTRVENSYSMVQDEPVPVLKDLQENHAQQQELAAKQRDFPAQQAAIDQASTQTRLPWQRNIDNIDTITKHTQQLQGLGVNFKGQGINPVTLAKAADLVSNPKLGSYLKAVGRDPLRQLNTSDVASMSRLVGLSASEIQAELAQAGVPVLDSNKPKN